VSTITHGHLLNGRIRYAQPAEGFRSGIEPVLLAAAIPALPGQRVLEGGTGAGAALLCLMSRVPDVTGLGIERDPDQAALARANAAANDLRGLEILTGDIETAEPAGVFDHAFANPPYHPASGSASPNVGRLTAKQAAPDLLARWTAALVRPLRPRGSVTLILPAASLPACIVALAAAKAPVDAVLPLWPKAGVPAKLILVRGIKGGRAAMRLLPGLELHQSNGQFTDVANAILRDGAALGLDH
jgi:tRNA1Val (adenine37-N6)-methyltransferase